MYCLRKLHSFRVCQPLLQTFYTAIVLSILTFAMSCWGGNMSKQDKNRLEKIIRKAGGVIGTQQADVETLYNRVVTRKFQAITSDSSHPLRQEFDSRQCERSNRLRAPCTKTSRYKQSFIPTAIRKHNTNTHR